MMDMPPLSALMSALNFSAEDIALNRRRELSAVQRDRLHGLQRRTLLITGAVFLLLAFVAAVAIYMGQRNQQIGFSLIGVGLTVVNAILVGFAARSILRIAADLREASPIEIYEGILKRVLRPTGQVNNYVLRLAGKEFSVDKETFRLFRHELAYAIYATQHANVLMSAECLTDPHA